MGSSDPLAPDDVAGLIRRMFADATDPVGVARGLDLVAANPSYVALFGYDREEELLGRSVLDLIAPSARPMVIELARRRAMGEVVPGSYVTRILRCDGSEVDVEMRTTAFELGGEQFIFALHRRVPEQPVRAFRHADFYRALFEDNPAIKLLISPTDGFIIDANPAAIDFYGWPLEELREMRISDINTLTDDEVREEMENARSGKRRYFRFRHRIASGEVRAVEVHAGPVEVEGESLLFSIIHDVTERDALEEQLRDAQRLEAVGRLAGAVAHDFNNLLTVVLSSAELIVRKLPADSRLKRLGDDMRFATERAVDLARDLLAFSRRQLMRPSTVDLNGTVATLSGVLQRLLGDAVSLTTALSSDLPPTRVDPRQLEQVLMNLVFNARDAMQDGGSIQIESATVELDKDGPVPAGTWITLSVSDDGEGMPPEVRNRIFEPYFTTKGSGQGTGLGLATAEGIIRQCGGHITVDSAPAQGTTFTLYLPIAAPSEVTEPPIPSSPTSQVDPSTRWVLLVDDQDLVRKALAAGLEEAGFSVVAVGSADEAEAAFAKRRFDVLVSDVVMPRRSGLDLAAALLETRPSLPVLLISGDLRGHDLDALPRTVRTLQKPFTAPVLLEEIGALLDR